MHRPALVRPAAVTIALGLSLTACGSSTKSGGGETSDPPPPPVTASANGIDCASAGDLDATPKLKPPAGFPIVSGGHLYLAKGPFGKTELFFVWKQADPTNLDAVRDEAANLLVQAGYTLERKDQEEGSESEAHLSGKQEVAIQVIQLCTERVRIKYTLG